MTAQDYWEVVIQSTQQHDGDGYTDLEEDYTCPVSWLSLVMVHVNSKKITSEFFFFIL